jgi:hypothetical protein
VLWNQLTKFMIFRSSLFTALAMVWYRTAKPSIIIANVTPPEHCFSKAEAHLLSVYRT